MVIFDSDVTTAVINRSGENRAHKNVVVHIAGTASVKQRDLTALTTPSIVNALCRPTKNISALPFKPAPGASERVLCRRPSPPRSGLLWSGPANVIVS